MLEDFDTLLLVTYPSRLIIERLILYLSFNLKIDKFSTRLGKQNSLVIGESLQSKNCGTDLKQKLKELRRQQDSNLRLQRRTDF